MKYLFYLISLVCLISCKQEVQYHLLVVEEINSDKNFSGRKQVLCQYTMVDTGFVREVLYHENTFYPYNHSIQPNDYRITKNRFLVRKNGWHIYDLEVDSFAFQNEDYGDIYDFTDKYIVFTKKREYLDYRPGLNSNDSDSIDLTKTVNSNYPDFTVFDFELGQLVLIDSFQVFSGSKTGVFSPDKLIKVTIDSIIDFNYPAYDDYNCAWTRNFFVNGFYTVQENNKDIMIVRIGYINNIWQTLEKTPILWLNNKQFITQQENNQLILVDTETKKISKFPKIEDIELCALSKFETDYNGDIYFVLQHSQNSVWRIDAEKLTLEKVDKVAIGKDLEKNSGYVNLRTPIKPNYYYKGKSILNDSTQTEHYDILDNYLAIQCGEETHERPDYINLKIFDTKTKDLKTLKIKNMVGWIGWVKR